MKKSILVLSLIIALILSCTSAFAETTVTVMIDSVPVEFNAEMGAPFIDANNRTQVPFRATMEAFGAKVDWDKETRTAIATMDGVEVKVPIGTATILKDGVEEKIDTESLIKDDRTYLPIRAVVEAFGATINWDKDAKNVVIDKANLDAMDVVLKATEKSQSWKNYDMDMSMAMKMSIPAENQTVDMTMDMDGIYTAFLDKDNMKIKGVMNTKTNFMGQTQEQPIEQYITGNKDGMVVYQNIDDQWTKMEITDKKLMEQAFTNVSDSLEKTKETIKDAKYLGDYTVDDKDLMKIEITVSSDIYNDLLNGSLSSLTSSLGEDEAQLENILGSMGDFSYILWIDKDTEEVVKYTMDMTDIYKSVVKAVANEEEMTEQDLAALQNIEAVMDVAVKNINSATDFEIPAEVEEKAISYEEYLKQIEEQAQPDQQ